MKTADRISAILILAICVYFWTEADSFTKYGRFFPQIITIILGLLTLVLLIMSFTKPLKEKVFTIEVTKYIIIIISIILFIVWVFFINILGFVTSSVIFFSIMNVILSKKGKKFSHYAVRIGMVIIIILFFYIFFSRILLVPFPSGLLL